MDVGDCVNQDNGNLQSYVLVEYMKGDDCGAKCPGFESVAWRIV